ncbi:3,4-dihydroxy-2-butanone-4-phosphate synthase [Mesoterricola sediminis]|uniref:3,4-dihydroxy-2-butanone 4-phosphate synthase n=1 Tax=Mesoterricola sediminis TaxID=2927980 RepID=A0AA48H1I4_9BACT|nr:3,4-dihydroxy-2-butanone-4-phosphate synthase [Mesoterricola sediminis]BDU78285.1 riboflavin biosynthesis protein RibBA [Mesoterricola sediminis]
MDTPFSEIETAIEAIRQGRMVVVVDDEDRENEGDLTLAAEKVTPELIAFMATHGRGLICTALEGGLLDRLHIPQMVQDNTSPFETAFCVSVEAREGTSTGISAHDRARTIQALVAPGAKPSDFVKPGHVFPLRARAGGVLARTGQTEASVDLARLAGLHPSGVICEIMKDDGTMARVPDLIPFCRKFDLPLVTVAALVAHRLRVDPIIRPLGAARRETPWGSLHIHRFESLLDGNTHMAFVLGDLAGDPPLVRVHQESLPADLDGFGGVEPTPFHQAMEALRREGRGVLVYLRRPAGAPEGAAQGPLSDRDVGVGAQILESLGVREMRLLSRQEKKYIGLRGFGLDIVGHVHLDAQ